MSDLGLIDLKHHTISLAGGPAIELLRVTPEQMADAWRTHPKIVGVPVIYAYDHGLRVWPARASGFRIYRDGTEVEPVGG